MAVLTFLFIVSLTLFVVGLVAANLARGSEALSGFGIVLIIVGSLGMTHTSCYQAGRQESRYEIYRGKFDLEEYGDKFGWKKNMGE